LDRRREVLVPGGHPAPGPDEELLPPVVVGAPRSPSASARSAGPFRPSSAVFNRSRTSSTVASGPSAAGGSGHPVTYHRSTPRPLRTTREPVRDRTNNKNPGAARTRRRSGDQYSNGSEGTGGSSTVGPGSPGGLSQDLDREPGGCPHRRSRGAPPGWSWAGPECP
jgi:hypothetical protein